MGPYWREKGVASPPLGRSFYGIYRLTARARARTVRAMAMLKKSRIISLSSRVTQYTLKSK